MLMLGRATWARSVGRLVAAVMAIWLLALGGAAPVGGHAAARSPRCPHSSPERPEDRGEEAGWWKAERYELAPPGVAEIRLCRYGWPAEHLLRGVLLPGKRDAALVASFDALRPTPKRDQGHSFKSCFADSNPIVAYLAYPGGRIATVYVPTSSCWLATNGELTRSWPPAALEHLINELLQMTDHQ